MASILPFLNREDRTLVACYRSIYAPRTGGAYDSHHRTAGIAGRTRRYGSGVAGRGGCAAMACRSTANAMKGITEWLASIGLSEYAQRFADNAIDLSVIRDLTEQDLKDLGVLLGHRRKILRAIAERDGGAPEAARVRSHYRIGLERAVRVTSSRRPRRVNLAKLI